MNKTINLEAAIEIINAAKIKAQEIGVPMNIAVVDEGGNLVAFERMDGAWLGSIDIAQGKAYTARAFNMSTKELSEYAQPGGPLFGINTSNQGKLIIFAGGIPLKKDNLVVGAVGVSGGTVDQDHTVASAAAEKYK